MERQEFKSKLEDLMPAEELLFQPTPGFGSFYKPFLDHAIAHPAKMNTWLIEWLIKAFTEPGETVLDPMAGSGSTGIVAALHGRNAVQVELEKKFYDWMEKAKENIEKNAAIQQKGWIKNICGDARRLSQLLRCVDICITSPPYSETHVGDNQRYLSGKLSVEENRRIARAKEDPSRYGYSDSKENIGNLPHGDVDAIVTSPPYAEGIGHDSGDNASEQFKERLEMQRRYTRQMVSEGNIANLPLGKMDAIITSPPFGDSYTGGGDPEKRKERLIKAGHDPNDFLGGKARNAVLKHYNEVDTVITSPPYSESMTKRRKGYTVIPGLEKTREMPQDTRDDNIANLSHGNIAAIITSPPYERQHQGGCDSPKVRHGCIKEKYPNEENIANLPMGNVDAVITSPPYSERTEHRIGYDYQKRDVERGYQPYKGFRESYSEKTENIGNLKHGEISAIITSPPFGEANRGGGIAQKGYEGKYGKDEKLHLRHDRPLSENPDNISNLPFGSIDCCITSPPYSDIAKSKDGAVSPHMQGLISKLSGIPVKEFAHDVEKLKEAVKIAQSKIPFKYSDSQENIGNLPHGSIDAVITSPPYADGKKAGEVKLEEVEKYARRWEENVEKRGWNSWGKSFHTPGRLRRIMSLRDGYSESKENIGNLPFVDTVITSPPYEASVSDNKESPLAGGDEKKYGRWRKGTARKHSYTQHGEPCKVDTVITSPPYEGSLEGTTRHTRGGIASRDPALAQTGSYATVMSFGVPVGYSPNPENIGNLKSSDKEYEALIDAVVTSPPYAHESTASKETRLERQGKFKMGHSKEEPYTEEDYKQWDKHVNGNIGKRKLFIRIPCSPEEAQFHDTRPIRKGTVWEWTKEVEATPEVIEKIQKLKSEEKGRSETYLEAMLKVYAEMFRVLKPGGLAIIVVKPFIRSKKVVDLPYHTWLLMATVGFRLAKLYKLRLKQQSFWRILLYKKHPEVPVIAHEYVLVCQKLDSEPSEVEPRISPLDFMVEMAARETALKIEV